MSRVFFVSALLVLTASCATTSRIVRGNTSLPIWGSLSPGSHEVGFRSLDDGAGVWFPSTGQGTPMRYRDYFSSLDAIEKLLHEKHVSDDTIADLFDIRMFARQNVQSIETRYPVVIITGGSSATHAVLGEFIASHGYIVAILPARASMTKLSLDGSTDVATAGAQYVHGIDFSTLKLASSRLPELAAVTKSAGDMSVIAKNVLQLIESQRAR